MANRSRDDIIAQIAKLRRLAERTDSEGEAAAALAAIQRLQMVHDLDALEIAGATAEEADLGLPEEAEALYGGRTRVTWRGALAFHLAQAHGCRTIWSYGGGSATLRLFGRKRDTVRVREMYAYACTIIDSMAARRRRHVPSWERPRSYLNSFRYGAAVACGRAVRAAAEAGREQERQLTGREIALFDMSEWLKQKFPNLRTLRNSLSSAAGAADGRAAGAGVFGPKQMSGGRLALGAGRRS